MHQSTLRYQKARWLKIASLLVVASIAAYAWHSPQPVANGGSWLGYTLGTIGALLIIWLAWFGIRKRSYQSTQGSLQGWLSAHVYLGSALLFIGTLHTGFQLAWNLHTLAYVLMCLVIASGIFGIVIYVRYPALLSNNRDNQTQAELLEQLQDASRQVVSSTQDLGQALKSAADSSIERTALGGSVWRQLSKKDYSTVVIDGELKPNPNQRAVIAHFAALLGDKSPQQNAILRNTIEALNRRGELLQRIRKDIRIRAMLDIWLLLHVPATIALLAALCAHIVVVFLYW